MATTTCPKCSSTRFEMKETVVSGSRYRLMFIQCASCGAAVGVQDYFNAGELLTRICKKLGIPF
ncbi:hypothetical protein BVZ25_20710 [Klebsiella quasipneumoniae]|nr:hypothetical protein BVZ25_20710 [Klebsiella quasipneumoniae]